MTTAAQSANHNSYEHHGSLLARQSDGHWCAFTPENAMTTDGDMRFNGTNDLNETLAALPEALKSRITIVDLRGTNVSDAMMTEVAGLPRLATLVLTQTDIDDHRLGLLKGKTGLAALDLSDTLITADSADLIASFTGLRSLILTQTPTTDALVPAIAKLPHLEILRIARTYIDDQALGALAAIKTLREIEFPATLSDESLSYFAQSDKLTALWLAHTNITDRCFDLFPESHTLTFLCLPHQLGDTGCASITRFRGLKSLWLEGDDITGAGIGALQTLSSLETLFFTAPLQDHAVRALSGLHALKRLCLFEKVATRYHVELLWSVPNLEELRIDTRELADDDCWMFSKFPKLRKLHLINSSFSPEAFVRLRESVPGVEVVHAGKRARIAPPMLAGEVHRRVWTVDGSRNWERCDPTQNDILIRPDEQFSFRASLSDELPEFVELIKKYGRLFVEAKFDTCHLNQEVIHALLMMPLLESLDMRACTFHPSLFITLASLSKLRKVVLDYTKLSQEDLKGLGSCSGISDLHIRAATLDDSGLLQLTGMSGLRSLAVDGAKIRESAVSDFKVARPNVIVQGTPTST